MTRLKRGTKRSVLLTLLVVVLSSVAVPGQALASPAVSSSLLASSRQGPSLLASSSQGPSPVASPGHGPSLHDDRPADGQGDSPLVP
jgi:hypothetical protein